MNAKDELLNFITDKCGGTLDLSILKCAVIARGDRNLISYNENFSILRVNHTIDEIDDFLQNLNFEYDNDYGTQELYGIIWFNDDSWANRGEYDGSEWWECYKLPEIPEELKN